MSWFLKLSILTVLIHSNVAVYLIPKYVITKFDASYTVMLVDDDANIKPKECYLSLSNDNRISYQINLTASGVPLEPNNTVLSPVKENSNIMTSLGSGICGFKLDNVGEKFVPQWNISFVDENDFFYYKVIDVFIRDIKFENETKYVTVGDEFTVQCGSDSISDQQYFLNCLLYDPQGTLVLTGDNSKKCHHFVNTSKMSDYGAWKCILQFENNMSPMNVYYNIVESEKMFTNLWQKETSTHVNIGCSFKNLGFHIDDKFFCELIRPDGEIFSLKEGLATNRYTALGTNISNAICGMEIKKPLQEFEKGLWRCEFKFLLSPNSRDPIGGFINLSNGSALPPPEIPKTILTLVNNEFSVSCRAPYSSSYCYMRGPNGTIYPVENNLQPTVGLCTFTKMATMADNGTWSCGFAKKTGEADELYSFEVSVLEGIAVKPEKEEVESIKGGKAFLICSTKDSGHNYPIQYCRFKHPYGQIYNINPEEDSTNRMSYYGRGFKYGDCGMEINSLSLSDAGMWTCITRAGNDFHYPEIYSEIKLRIN